MSAVKLTLRPPPNVEFVQGYPGIPSGADRPEAAVKGTIELRAGNQGVRAKWIRIELRKVETLPGGGQSNTFFDHVGQSPVNVWQTTSEYELLHIQDYPFNIRIPESIPPSLALEKNAGVKYELVAQLCVKGKKGFFRRDKSSIITTVSPVVIDKHELHSVWPLYQQPDARDVEQDGVVLTVERTSRCFGPGDRVAVMASLRSDAPGSVILRGFEFALREATVFRPGTGAGSRKAAPPQVRVNVVGEQKVPVNVTLATGTQHRAELACVIPSHHTTTTLSSARHIDITYTISVKALLGAGKPFQVELPVMISNWPRAVSIEATRRIGPTPNLSLQGPNGFSNMPTSPTVPYTPGANFAAATFSGAYGQTTATSGPERRYSSTMPVAQPNGFASTLGRVDEFGRSQPGVAPASRPLSMDSGSGRESRAPTQRFTVSNFADSELPPGGQDAIMRRPSAQPRLPSDTTPAQQSRWKSAEQEKVRLYELARAEADRLQSAAARAASPPSAAPLAASPLSSPPTSAPAARTAWPTAEEEKLRLYNEATARTARTQAGASSDGHSTDLHSPPPIASGSSGGGSSAPDAGALFAQAMSAVKQNASLPQPGVPALSPVRGQAAAYANAEQEKAMLERWHSARAAVDRTQGAGAGEAYEPGDAMPAPTPYDELYMPAPQRSASLASAQPLNAFEEKERLRRQYEAQDRAPPPRTPPPANQPLNAFQEKERLRRQYEEQDRAVAQPQPLPPAAITQPLNAYEEKERLRRQFEEQDRSAARQPPPFPSTPQPLNAFEEKERLRRQYDEQDRVAARSPPPPPMGSPLNAFEEKERLRRQYEAQDQAAHSPAMPEPHPYSAYNNGASAGGAWDAPPPLDDAPPAAGGSAPLNAYDEKERLRRKFAADDAGALGLGRAQTVGPGAGTPVPPPRRGASYAARAPPPTPGGSGAGPSLPTAADEKARLRAQYAADEASGRGTPVVPPPLKPRPPPTYIADTRREDARSQSGHFDLVPDSFLPLDGDDGASASGAHVGAPPKPPLPPKVPVARYR